MIVLPWRISRTFIQNHNEWLFIYSFDVAGKGIFGQAWIAHNEPNTLPVYVCWKMCKSSGYFSDSQLLEINSINDRALEVIRERGPSYKAIIPIRGIGIGHSRMSEFAPKAFEYLQKLLQSVSTPDIIWSTH